MFTVINFYKFIALDNVAAVQAEQQTLCERLGLRGTILLASEGINAGLSGSDAAIDEYVTALREHPMFFDAEVKRSYADIEPYGRLYVKVKRSIVTFSESPELSIEDIKSAGRISPAEFREHVLNPSDNVVIVDTRNKVEIDYGKFSGAKALGISKFKEFTRAFDENFSSNKDKTFLMYCTGGIRCEKAAAAVKKLGYEKVYQLEGGIINYFKEFGNEGYEGACFVFDNRWAITPQLAQSDIGPHPDQVKKPKTAQA